MITLKKKLLLVIVLCILLAFILYNNGYDGITSSEDVTISTICNYKEYVNTNDLVALDSIEHISYKILDKKKVLLVDARNNEKKLYIHSDVSGNIDSNGCLSIIIKDSFAVSEKDITGTNTVMLESLNDIKEVSIKIIDESKNNTK